MTHVTVSADSSKSGDPAFGSIVFAATGGQTHWFDVVVEGDRRGQLQQGDVIAQCNGTVTRMLDDSGHFSWHHVGVGAS